MTRALEVKDLSVAIDGQAILRNISLSLAEADIACLLGPSGCGKTTLLRCIAGFERQQQGEIWIKGTRISSPIIHFPVEQRHIGMVFQDHALFPHLTVSDNIVFGLKKLDTKHAKRRLNELAELLSLEDHINKYPHSLSGGQQQRVALARAMAPSPGLLLLDEPFASLDIELREQIAKELHKILKQEGITTIMVSHNQLEAFAMADVIGVMNDGQLLQWDNAFKLYHEPDSLMVANFIGEGVFIPGQVLNEKQVKTEMGVISGKTVHRLKQGEAVNVLIRPDDVLHDNDSDIMVRIKDKIFRGAGFLYTLELKSGSRLLGLVPSHHNYPLNETIGIRLETDHLVIFPR